MIFEFLEQFLTSIFGNNWRTSISAIITAIAAFIYMNNDLLPNPDGLIARLAAFVVGGGCLAFGINAKDKQVTGSSKDIDPRG